MVANGITITLSNGKFSLRKARLKITLSELTLMYVTFLLDKLWV